MPDRHFESVAKMLTSALLQRSLCIKFLEVFSSASALRKTLPSRASEWLRAALVR
jgi:hypothetical protein